MKKTAQEAVDFLPLTAFRYASIKHRLLSIVQKHPHSDIMSSNTEEIRDDDLIILLRNYCKATTLTFMKLFQNHMIAIEEIFKLHSVPE